jgi:hypothetical protein
MYVHDVCSYIAPFGPSPLDTDMRIDQTDLGCAASDVDYVIQFNDQCSNTNMQRWADLSDEALSKQSDKGECKTDPVTKKVSCDLVLKECDGGSPQSLVDTVETSVIAYPCGTDCKGVLLVKCCEECTNNQMLANGNLYPFNDMPTTVQCPGCDKAALDSIVKDNTNKCSVGADGRFRCSFSESCKLGAPQVTKTTTERKCTFTPCDVCTDADVKAQCCHACLTNVACKGGADAMLRAVCRGCESASAPRMPTPSPTPAPIAPPTPSPTYYVAPTPYPTPYRPPTPIPTYYVAPTPFPTPYTPARKPSLPALHSTPLSSPLSSPSFRPSLLLPALPVLPVPPALPLSPPPALPIPLPPPPPPPFSPNMPSDSRIFLQCAQ